MSRPRRLDHATRWLPLTAHQERFIKHELLREACGLGPSVALQVQVLWADSIIETAREIYQLLHLSRRYTAERLQAACRRAAYYHQNSNCFTIDWVLESGFDRLPLSPYTDIRGHFVFAVAETDGQHPHGSTSERSV